MALKRILIVEDEILIADTIKRYLLKKGYQVIGLAISYEEAEELFMGESPDLVLLDIRLNGPRTGIDFAHFIRSQTNPPPFIYLTSQLDHRSLTLAKETFPAGYLTKPIQKTSLFTTIEIALHSHDSHSSEESNKSIEIFEGNKRFLIPASDVMYIKSDHVYVHIQLVGGRAYLQRASLKEILDQLPQNQFIQTHRSFAINRDKVRQWDHQNIYIEDEIIPVSRGRKKAVHAFLQKK